MKITHLTEAKKLPGAVNGVKIMSPEEFVQMDSEVDETIDFDQLRKDAAASAAKTVDAATKVEPRKPFMAQVGDKIIGGVGQGIKGSYQGFTRDQEPGKPFMAQVGNKIIGGVGGAVKGAYKGFTGKKVEEDKTERETNRLWQMITDYERRAKMSKNDIRKEHYMKMAQELRAKLPTSDLEEATKLPAQSREFGGDEFQDYMTRIVGTPDIDKKTGKVKVDKKGNEKYTTGKTKTDKYKMPYMHRSSVVTYYDEAGKRFREEQVIEALQQRPKKLLKQNEKMKHSNGALEQFFNVGFAALTGVAVDESTGKLIIVNTCPGAGSCKVDCFAMKGGKVQFKAAWLSDGRILTYLLNDPTGFFTQLSNEIAHEEKLGKKGGYNVTIRWHDAGDFFSPEYLDLALKMAKKHPDVKFYAYTKMAGAALAKKPNNFIINWSEGAHTSQEKQVKAQDPELDTTKNSRIVPDELFQDLLIKDQKGNLVKGSQGQWQVQPDKLPELKQRLGKQYGISPSSILSYDEYTSKPKISGMKYNVIVAPGEGDISANDPDVISTLLLRH